MAEKARDEVKLLSLWLSPYAISVQLALKLAGVSYEVLEQDIRNKSQLLLDSNPVHKKVPVLLHNGRPICESPIIVQYIDEVWNVGLMPKDPYARAELRFWADFIDSKLTPAAAPVLRSAKAAPEASQAYIEGCCVLEEHLLSKMHKDKPFVGGDRPNYFDVMLAGHAGWSPGLLDFGVELPSEEKCPRFRGLFDALHHHPAAKSIMPDPEKVNATYCQWFPDRSTN